MNKRKGDSATYKEAGASIGDLAAKIADWDARTAVDVASEPQTGVAANRYLQPTADVASEPQLGVAANRYLQSTADVAREPQLGIAANQHLQPISDVAREPQLGWTANIGPGRETELGNGLQPTTAAIWAEPLGTEEGTLSTQTTSEEDLGSGPLYTDFWALLADAGYETW